MHGIIAQLRGLSDCVVLPPAGQPESFGYALPADLHTFYDICGGLELFSQKPYGIGIVPPTGFVRANPVIRGCSGEGDISYDWFMIGKTPTQFITIDLDRERLGRCYDSFWDRHALRGESTIIALSLTELLQRLVESKGEYWYWLRSDFRSYGDAYSRV